MPFCYFCHVAAHFLVMFVYLFFLKLRNRKSSTIYRIFIVTMYCFNTFPFGCSGCDVKFLNISIRTACSVFDLLTEIDREISIGIRL